MRKYLAIACISIVTLGACDTATSTQAPTVVDPLIGKRLAAADGTVFLIQPDGTMGGQLGGAEIVGTYTANATESCSVYTAPEQLTGREFCSTPQIEGDTVIFLRRDGTKSQPYKVTG